MGFRVCFLNAKRGKMDPECEAGEDGPCWFFKSRPKHSAEIQAFYSVEVRIMTYGSGFYQVALQTIKLCLRFGQPCGSEKKTLNPKP